MSDPTGDAVRQEKEMREHEAEARKRDPDERNPEAGGDPMGDQGTGTGDDPTAAPTPPGEAGRMNISGG